MRYKKTEICQTCAKLKNVCQTCILDLEYGLLSCHPFFFLFPIQKPTIPPPLSLSSGLPVQVRDAALQLGDSMPRDEINRQYFAQQAEQQVSQTPNINHQPDWHLPLFDLVTDGTGRQRDKL